MNEYPDRVTLYEDGVYRWAYTMNMWKNRYMIRLIYKILVPLLGIPLLLVAAMAVKNGRYLLQQGIPREDLMSFMRGDMIPIYVIGGLLVGMLLLIEIIYAICALAMHGTWRMCYEMDESAVALVRNPKTMQTMNTFGAVVGVIGLLAGKTSDVARIGGTLATINETGTSRFEFASRVKRVRKYDVLDMREFMSMNQIYVPGEDYDYVRDFILSRIPEKARLRSQKEV